MKRLSVFVSILITILAVLDVATGSPVASAVVGLVSPEPETRWCISTADSNFYQ